MYIGRQSSSVMDEREWVAYMRDFLPIIFLDENRSFDTDHCASVLSDLRYFCSLFHEMLGLPRPPHSCHLYLLLSPKLSHQVSAQCTAVLTIYYTYQTLATSLHGPSPVDTRHPSGVRCAEVTESDTHAATSAQCHFIDGKRRRPVPEFANVCNISSRVGVASGKW
jgi:hypothetical protein